MTAGVPSQLQRERKRVRHLSSTGSSSVASCQFLPPSVETSTAVIRPLPDQANPWISWSHGRSSFMPPEGRVITDLHSMAKLNCRHLPSGIGSVYRAVSLLKFHGWSPTLIRRSHFTDTLPSQPGMSARSGRSEEHTSELQSLAYLVCRLLLEK